MKTMQQDGATEAQLAKQYKTSRQTISTNFRRLYDFSEHPMADSRIFYMHGKNLCTVIDVDHRNEKVYAKNFTEKPLLTAFGRKREPTWQDYQLFLTERCFPQSRAHSRQILRDMGLDFFGPRSHHPENPRPNGRRSALDVAGTKSEYGGSVCEKLTFKIRRLPPARGILQGQQFKWPADGGWYKADHMGYESLAEIIVSRLLQRSELPYPHVLYEPAVIHYDGHTLRGCFSENFLPENREIVTLEKLFRQYTGAGLSATLAKIPEVPDKIRRTVDTVVEITGP